MNLFLLYLGAVAVVAFETLFCLSSVLLLGFLAAAPLYADRLPFAVQSWMWAAAFSAACMIGVVASWIKGVIDKRLPARIGGDPQHSHISGWSFIWIVLITGALIAVAQWAAINAANRQLVNNDWGLIVLGCVLAAFVLAALAPGWHLHERAGPVLRAVGRFVRPLGRLLSFIDGVLVFAVAGAAGATQNNTFLRYSALVGALSACGVMGYWLEPPWGLVPIAWGFIFTVAISRRWAWVESDRELAMLNRRFVGPHLRIGFEQDLRDEALLSFAALFILVPLAFRQAQLGALAAGTELFNVDAASAESMWTWFAFFGAELAKALPFVDWAGVYGVGGGDAQIVQSVPSQHIEFALRALVDLVLLAALLQALAISARNAAQRGLFYEGQLDRLDPFIEPTEFRKLLRRTENGLEPDPEKISGFPVYDPIRLSEYASSERSKLLRSVTTALRIHQGGDSAADFHRELVKRATDFPRDKLAIMEVLRAIRAVGPQRLVGELAEARRALNNSRNMTEARVLTMELLLEAPDSAEKATALRMALDSERDTSGAIRLAALRGLIESAERGDDHAISALTAIAQQRTSESRHARAALAREKRQRQRRRPAPALAAAGPTVAQSESLDVLKGAAEEAESAPLEIARSPGVAAPPVVGAEAERVETGAEPAQVEEAEAEDEAPSIATLAEPARQGDGVEARPTFPAVGLMPDEADDAEELEAEERRRPWLAIAAVATCLVIVALVFGVQTTRPVTTTTARVPIPSEEPARSAALPPPLEQSPESTAQAPVRAPPALQAVSPAAPTQDAAAHAAPIHTARPQDAPAAQVSNRGVVQCAGAFTGNEATVFIVSEGDTLSQIAWRCYGDAQAWRTVARCNVFLEQRNLGGVSPLHGGDLLYVGDQLVLPTGERCPGG